MDVISMAHQSFVDTVGRFAEHASGGFAKEVGGWAALATGLPVPILNVVTPASGTAEVSDVATAAATMIERGLPYSVVLMEDTHADLEPAVLDLGLSVSMRSPVMVGSELPVKPWPEELTKQTGPDAVGDHAIVVTAAFGLPAEMIGELTSLAFASDPTVDIVVGSLDGEPVLTALGVTIGGVTGVFNVGTTMKCRGRGYGAAVTSAVVQAGGKRGATLTALQSSEIGISVYAGMGYQTVATQVHYT